MERQPTPVTRPEKPALSEKEQKIANLTGQLTQICVDFGIDPTTYPNFEQTCYRTARRLITLKAEKVVTQPIHCLILLGVFEAYLKSYEPNLQPSKKHKINKKKTLRLLFTLGSGYEPAGRFADWISSGMLQKFTMISEQILEQLEKNRAKIDVVQSENLKRLVVAGLEQPNTHEIPDHPLFSVLCHNLDLNADIALAILNQVRFMVVDEERGDFARNNSNAVAMVYSSDPAELILHSNPLANQITVQTLKHELGHLLNKNALHSGLYFDLFRGLNEVLNELITKIPNLAHQHKSDLGLLARLYHLSYDSLVQIFARLMMDIPEEELRMKDVVQMVKSGDMTEFCKVFINHYQLSGLMHLAFLFAYTSNRPPNSLRAFIPPVTTYETLKEYFNHLYDQKILSYSGSFLIGLGLFYVDDSYKNHLLKKTNTTQKLCIVNEDGFQIRFTPDQQRLEVYSQNQKALPMHRILADFFEQQLRMHCFLYPADTDMPEILQHFLAWKNCQVFPDGSLLDLLNRE